MARPRGVWSDKQFRDAVRKAVMERGADGKQKLEKIAVGLVDAAVECASWAVVEVANRLDGRPAQDITIEQNITHELAGVSDADIARELIRRGSEAASAAAVREGELH